MSAHSSAFGWGRRRHLAEGCARPSIRAGQSPGATQGDRVAGASTLDSRLRGNDGCGKVRLRSNDGYASVSGRAGAGHPARRVSAHSSAFGWGRRRHWREGCARPSIRAGQGPGATQGDRVAGVSTLDSRLRRPLCSREVPAKAGGAGVIQTWEAACPTRGFTLTPALSRQGRGGNAKVSLCGNDGYASVRLCGNDGQGAFRPATRRAKSLCEGR